MYPSCEQRVLHWTELNILYYIVREDLCKALLSSRSLRNDRQTL
jgi:hypothetical protein